MQTSQPSPDGQASSSSALVASGAHTKPRGFFSSTRRRRRRVTPTATAIAMTPLIDDDLVVTQTTLWQEALSQQMSKMGDADRDYIVQAGISVKLGREQLDEFISSLQSQYDAQVSSQLLQRISPIMSHIQSFGRVVDTLVQSNPNVAALVWGAVRLVIEISARPVRLCEKIMKMLEELSGSLPLFERWRNLFPQESYPELSQTLRETCTSYFGFLVESVKFLRRSAVANMLRTTCYPQFESTFDAAEDRISRQTKHLQLQLQTAGYQSEQQRHQTMLNILRFTQFCSRNNRFYGRRDLLASLDTTFGPGMAASENPRLTSVVLYGLGGIGKSSTALEYMFLHYDTYPVIIWFYADKKDKLDTQFTQLARMLGFSDKDGDSETCRDMVLHWINNLDANFLIVFDNADDAGLLPPYWPSARHGNILITSRNSFEGKAAFASSGIKMKRFDSDDGSCFIQSFLDVFPDLPEDEKKATRQIVRNYDGLPLALRQAGQLMRNKKCLPSVFLEIYPQSHAEMQRMEIPGYSKTMADVWEISYGVLSEDAMTLLDLLAVMDPDVIPIVLFRQFGRFSSYSSFLVDEMRYMNATESLIDQSLIDMNMRDKTLSLHRFFQDATFQRLIAQKDRFEEAVCGVLHMMLQAIPEDDYLSMKHHNIWEAMETYVAHAEMVFTRCMPRIPPKAVNALLDILCRIAGYYYEIGQYHTCDETIDKAQSVISNATSPVDDLVLSRVYYYHGRMCQEVNRPEHAVNDFEKATMIMEKLAESRPELERLTYLAILYENLGMSCIGAERFDEAEVYLKKCISIASQPGAETRCVLGDFIQCLGACYLWRGRDGDLDLAEDTLQRAVLERCGANNENLGGALYSLGNVYYAQKRYADSLEKHQEVLRLYMEDCGEDHHWVADSLHKIGSILVEDFDQRDLFEAENLLRKCLQIWDSPRYKDSVYSIPARIRAKWKLAQILSAAANADEGQIEEAERLYEEACTYVSTHHGLVVTRDTPGAQRHFDSLVFYWNR